MPPTRGDPKAPETVDPEIDNWVSASEVGAFEYCARAYWLQHVHEIESTIADARLAEGTVRHQAYGRLVLWQRWLLRLAAVLFIVACVVTCVVVLWLR